MDVKRETAEERFNRMDLPEAALRRQGILRIAGVDEAGRGPLAGPVYAAAVILDPSKPIWGLNDSKRLSAKRRDVLYADILEKAACWGIASASAEEIDRLNILEATRLAMRRAIARLTPQPEYILFDYIPFDQFRDCPADFLKKGDAVSNAIAAASILAKVTRDREMLHLAETYPGYGFESHKGYGTAAHYAALDANGPCALHRRSFLGSWFARQKTASKDRFEPGERNNARLQP